MTRATKEDYRRALSLAARLLLVFKPDINLTGLRIPDTEPYLENYEQLLQDLIDKKRNDNARPHENAQTHDPNQLTIIVDHDDQ